MNGTSYFKPGPYNPKNTNYTPSPYNQQNTLHPPSTPATPTSWAGLGVAVIDAMIKPRENAGRQNYEPRNADNSRYDRGATAYIPRSSFEDTDSRQDEARIRDEVGKARMLESENLEAERYQIERRESERREAEQIDRAFRGIAEKMGIVSGQYGQPDNFQSLIDQTARGATWTSLKREVQEMNSSESSQSGRPRRDEYIDETPQAIKDRVLGYENGYVVETPAGMTKSEALGIIEEAKREAQGNARSREYQNNELRNLLDLADRDARDLRSGGTLQQSESLPAENAPSTNEGLVQRLKVYIKKREEIDQNALNDPQAPKSYIPESKKLEKKLQEILDGGKAE